MKRSLSPRLLECCQYIHPGDRIADVGCDHGYLSIHLLKNGIASFSIASDIRKGPLHSAMENAEKFQVAEHMAFYLSDGLQQVPRDFDCMVCAGMGAETMISILKAAPWLQTCQYRLVLQCQTRTHLLRKYLSQTGWFIKEESIVRDGHFLYTVMSVVWEPGHSLSAGQCYLSPALLQHTGDDLNEYSSRILKGLRQAVLGRGENAPADMIQAYRELCTDPSFPVLGGNHDNC